MTTSNFMRPIALLIAVTLVTSAIIYKKYYKKPAPPPDTNALAANSVSIKNTIIPQEGVEIPITWGDIGKRLIDTGTIDQIPFESIYEARGGIGEVKRLTSGREDTAIVINRENAGILLNLLWAFGLSNKNDILENGPIASGKYGGDPSRFASTAGWTLAKGNPMNHYNKHEFIRLTNDEQNKVENVSKGIYRPCCANSTHFPDCNHGMAMLGLLQLLAKEGMSENEMYDIALKVNSYWFPDTYMTIGEYFEKRHIAWADVDPKTVLGAEYSSAVGYRRVLEEINPVEGGAGGGCSA